MPPQPASDDARSASSEPMPLIQTPELKGCTSLLTSAAGAVQVQEFMMQGGQGWNRDVLALPECDAQLSPSGQLVW